MTTRKNKFPGLAGAFVKVTALRKFVTQAALAILLLILSAQQAARAESRPGRKPWAMSGPGSSCFSAR